MDNFVLLGAATAGGMVVAGAAAYLYHQLVGLDDRIRRLEDAYSKRLNHRTAANIEDITAVLLGIIQEREVEDVRIKQALRLAQIARTDPDKYDPDAPNGKGKR